MDTQALVTTLTAATQTLDDLTGVRLPQRAYLILQRAIRNMLLPPGEMVLEDDVAQALGMSRTPIHEALIRLQSEDLVAIIPRHGFQVVPLLVDVLRDIYEIAEGIEGIAVALAAERATPGDMAELEKLQAQAETALAANDLIAWAEIDDLFHRTLLRSAKNQRLSRLADQYAAHLYRARLYTIRLRANLTLSISEHTAVLAAIRAGNPHQAQALHQAHRHRTRGEILGVIEALNPNMHFRVDYGQCSAGHPAVPNLIRRKQ